MNIFFLEFVATYRIGVDPESGSSRDWARLTGIPLSFTFELRDNGTYGFELPQDQIQPTCEEAYSGVKHIVNYVHHKKVSGAGTMATTSLWAVLLASCITTTTITLSRRGGRSAFDNE
ncbi:hypothetical protein NHX12_014774 [Muraenolepis orangiensis]|uniref:Peptidase M14 domain-containing protein n=1 Tax=Muraenolepis orangiensis TaxID=630683 RepID=A0A9Q0I444_9TELE|nr:hypothetical protein NHX12_014774 [Muraenolepis orangiensis]